MQYRSLRNSLLIPFFCSVLLYSQQVCAQYLNAERDIFTPLKNRADLLLKTTENSITPAQVLKILDSLPAPLSLIPLPIEKKSIPLSARMLYKRNCNAIALIAMCTQPDALHGTRLNHASGFVVTSDGVLVTNYHVLYAYAHAPCVADKGVLLIRLNNGKIYAIQSILALSAENDLAVLKLDNKNETLPYIAVSTQDAGIGDAIYVLGNSTRQLYGLTTGIISGKYNETMPSPSGNTSFNRNLLSITAEFSVGASGSPVLNRYGQVIGVVSSTFVIEQFSAGHAQSQMTIKNAIPVSSLQKLWK